MTNNLDLDAKAYVMTDSERLAWLRQAMDVYRLTWGDLTKYTGYSYSSVGSWFCSPESTRHRAVPARAIDRLQLEIKNGNVWGSK